MPGAAWLSWDRQARRDPLEWVAEAAGLSIGLTALAGAFFFWIGLRLSAVGLVTLYVMALAAWLAGRWRTGFKGWRISLPGLAAAAFVLGLVAWRVYQAQGLVMPAWVDSVQHALLVRKIIEYGGVPPDWTPYLPVPLFYHFGFHAIAASFSVLAQLEPAQTLLSFGQVLNAAVAFSVYRLGKVLWNDWRPAVLAALLAEFAFTMPAYYLTWGRYPLLAGLVLMALAMAAALELRNGRREKWLVARLVVYTVGVCFTHYLAAGLLVLFYLVMAVAEAINFIKSRSLSGLNWRPFAAGAIAAVLSAPWLLRVWQYSHDYAALVMGDPFDPGRSQTIRDTLNYILYLVGPQRGYVLLCIAGIGLILAFIRPGKRVLAAWSLLLAFEATPFAPQLSPFRPDHAAIVLFLPASLLIVELLWQAKDWLSAIQLKYVGRFAQVLPLLVTVGFLGWGAFETRSIVNPVTVFTTQADVNALSWIGANTPSSARFFINGAPWQGAAYRGVDGGYWIMPATGRFTVVVPVAIGMGSNQDISQYEDWARRASGITQCDDAFWGLVKEARLDYIYVRQGAGSLKPEALVGCRGISELYDREGVYIYKISLNP